LEYIFISPAQHQLHHSVAFEHHDKNFGAALAVWDWLFGSLHHSVEFETLHLGIKKDQKETTHNLKSLYFDPIYEIKKHIINTIKKIKNKFNKLILKGRYINEV